MKQDQTRTRTILIIAGVVALLLGGVSWAMLQSRSDRAAQNMTPSTAVNSQKKPSQSTEKLVSVTETNLPQGWNVEVQEPGRVMSVNTSTGCYADTSVTAVPAESAGTTDHKAKIIENMRSKGFIIKERPAGKLAVQTKSGEQQLDTIALNVNKQNVTLMYQEYAYIAKDGKYSQVQLSCSKEADLAGARQAQSAVKLEI